MFSSGSIKEESYMNCISRRDAKDKNLFVQENTIQRRWNLYSKITIENDSLKCAKANETYPLIKLCNDQAGSQPCTFQDTNEVVDIGYDLLSLRYVEKATSVKYFLNFI